jgi:hypothetical protein
LDLLSAETVERAPTATVMIEGNFPTGSTAADARTGHIVPQVALVASAGTVFTVLSFALLLAALLPFCICDAMPRATRPDR